MYVLFSYFTNYIAPIFLQLVTVSAVIDRESELCSSLHSDRFEVNTTWFTVLILL